jgi:hypothetical protein
MNNFPSNSNFSPVGYNDNNFNRRTVPSNIFPMDGGMTGNPTGRFNPHSTNSQRQFIHLKIHLLKIHQLLKELITQIKIIYFITTSERMF